MKKLYILTRILKFIGRKMDGYKTYAGATQGRRWPDWEPYLPESSDCWALRSPIKDYRKWNWNRRWGAC